MNVKSKLKSKSKVAKLALFAVLAMQLSACSVVEPRHQGNVYGSSSMGKAQVTTYARIVDIQDAYIQSENGNLLVASIGAIAGGYIGKHIGGGTGNEIARVFGAVAGGYGANEAYRKHGSMGKVKQFTIQTAGGGTYTVLQSDPKNEFSIGQTVKVFNEGNKVKISR